MLSAQDKSQKNRFDLMHIIYIYIKRVSRVNERIKKKLSI